MRQRLLENVTLGLEEVFHQACTLEAAARNAESYRPTSQSSAVKVLQLKREEELPDYAATLTEKCFFCGNKKHPRSRCPARGVDCYKCQKKGHFAKACTSITSSAVEVSESFETSDVQRAPHATLAMMNQLQIASVIDNVPSSLSKSSGVAPFRDLS